MRMQTNVEEEEKSFIKDLKRHARLAVEWGSPSLLPCVRDTNPHRVF